MNKQQVHTRLQQLTGGLKPAAGAHTEQLRELECSLTEQLTANSEFTVFGNRLHHEGAQHLEAVADEAEKFSQPDQLFEPVVQADEPSVAPLVFRRETEFRSNILGNSVPVWGSGMAVTESYGPFVDEAGIHVWFDFYQPKRLVRVVLQGSTTPVLLIPLSGHLSERTTYTIRPGSVWIASKLIAADPALAGYYTGLKISGGTLELSSISQVDQEQIIITAGVNAILKLNLKQNTLAATSSDAGFDASKATVELPKKCSLKFSAAGGKFKGDNASSVLFGCKTEFTFAQGAPTWIAGINQILVPYTVRSAERASDVFAVHSSKSKLSKFSGKAKIKSGSGWLLPAAKVDPAQLGEAAGAGALCIALREGISANWKGLKGSKTKLVLPAVMAEPGMLTVADFFAQNLIGKQKWRLWRNSHATHHSEITLSFGKAFPFVFVSAATGSEAIYFFCQHKASLDRPVDANGSPFKIESSIALAIIVQAGKTFRALLLDNDLLFDGNFQKKEAFERRTMILRNALFSVTRPYSLFLYGTLKDDEEITRGSLALQFGIHLYLPTLPDPYVATYTPYLRDTLALVEFAGLSIALTAFVKWPNPDEPRDHENAYLYFRFSPLDQSLLLGTAAADMSSFETDELPVVAAHNDFQVGVRTFNRNLVSDEAITRAKLPLLQAERAVRAETTTFSGAGLSEQTKPLYESGQIKPVVEEFEANPLLSHVPGQSDQFREALRAELIKAEQRDQEEQRRGYSNVPAPGSNPYAAAFGIRKRRWEILPDLFRLLDVSSNADQMGVGFGATYRVERSKNGDIDILPVDARMMSATGSGATMALQISNMDVVAIANQLRALTLPQISWEPIFNIPLPIEGAPSPSDTITVTPGLLVYDDDGGPTRIFSESPYLVPITPKSVTKHFLREFDDQDNPRNMLSFFTLPFAMVAVASFEKAGDRRSSLSFHRPQFNEIRGGLQIKTVARTTFSPQETNSFPGLTYQIDGNMKSFAGFRVYGSTLGDTVKTIFNQVMSVDQKKVPLEKIEFSGYGASIFSNWNDKAAAIADVSQTKFDVLVGRTAHEVVQVRSVMYMGTGLVHVVRTITLMRSANGYVYRSDSGWQPESDAFFDCTYSIDFGADGMEEVKNTYIYHPGPVLGVSNVREIMDYPDGGPFKSSFSLNQSGLPVSAPGAPIPTVLGKPLGTWQSRVFNSLTSFDEQLPVELQAVVFDGDVHFNNVASGGITVPGAPNQFRVQSRKMLGYVQLKPSSILISPAVLAELLKFQNGSLGGPIDCILDVAKSRQRMRMVRADLNPAPDGGASYVFVAAARGSLILPKDGSWSVVKHQTDTGDVKPIEEGQSVPLIRANGAPNFKIGDPGDLIVPGSKMNYGVLQSTGTQKLLFDTPQFTPGIQKLKSAQTYFADAYKLLNSKGVFPNIKNAMALSAAEKEIEIRGEGLMRMTERTLKFADLLPPNYEYAFIDEPGILKIYVDYKQLPSKPRGDVVLGIDSEVADLKDRWKAAVSNIRVVVDLGPFKELMWVNGNFNAASGASPKYDNPKLEFGTMLNTVKDILQILAALSGDDFNSGMNVAMSNTPGSWEYKFNCSQEIPVIKFPSAEVLLANPNPPLKLEAGLKVGFYFNEKISIPTDLKQLVPACGAYVDFYGRIEVMCFSLAAASIYAVGQVNLGISADTKAGISLRMKFGFGVEIVVGLPVVGNASVLYMMSIEVGIATNSVTVGAFMLFRGSAEICGGLVGITIQIEAGGSVQRQSSPDKTNCIAQVTFAINVCILWIIDISFSETWQESRQIS